MIFNSINIDLRLPNCQNSKYLKDLLLIYAKVHLTQQKASPHMIFNSINIDLRFFTFFINDPSEIFKIFLKIIIRSRSKLCWYFFDFFDPYLPKLDIYEGFLLLA